MRRFGIFAGTTAALLWAGAAQAQLSGPGHTDVLLGNSGGRITIGFNDDTQFYRDRFDSLPIDAATGHAIFPAKFGEFPGVGVLVTGTDDPGFQAYAGTFGSREYLYYRALGTLEVWTPTTQTWDAPTGGETVALYGALPPELRLTCAAVSPPPACIPYQDGTRIHADGITGPTTAVVARTGTNGSFHAHLDWFLRDDDASTPAAPGAYLVQLQIFSTAAVNGAPKYGESDPFYVLFNYQLTDEQYWSAFESLVSPTPVPEPETWALMLVGIVALLRRAQRSGVRLRD